MSHGVDDVVDSQLKGQAGKLSRVGLLLRPFPRVAKIHVVIDDHHESSVGIGNPHVFGFEAALFPHSSRVKKVDPGNLEQPFNVVVTVKDRMVDRKIERFVLWQDPLDLCVEPVPFLGTMEIIDDKQSASQQVLPECNHFGL